MNEKLIPVPLKENPHRDTGIQSGGIHTPRPYMVVTWRQLTVVAVICFLGALPLVHPYAGSWNDGSRLACVESLAERGTWILDGSLFVFPNGKSPDLPNPYDPASEILAQKGTLDLMQIEGHFYSDKSPVPSLVLAAIWKTGRFLGFPEPLENPGFFCWFMGVIGGALPFAIGAAAIFGISVRFAGSAGQVFLLFVGGSFACMAPCYIRHINNHILMWGISALVLGVMVQVSHGEGRRFPLLMWILGNALGMGYSVDSGIGPALVLGAIVWFVLEWRKMGWWMATFLVAGLLPWVALHHGLGYAIAGTLGPINANPDFFRWPGCPFNASSLTGGWKHPGVGKFCLYSADMLFGKKGILFHQGVGLLGALTLFAWFSFPDRLPDRSPLWACRVFFLAGFFVYAWGSNNQSGVCRSVRWFVPLGLPLWFAACLAWSQSRKIRKFWPWFVICGLLLSGLATWYGPWNGDVWPVYWVLAVLQVVLVVASLLPVSKLRSA